VTEAHALRTLATRAHQMTKRPTQVHLFAVELFPLTRKRGTPAPSQKSAAVNSDSGWLTWLVREAMNLNDISQEPSRLVDRLAMPFDTRKIDVLVESMIAKGFLKRDRATGRIVPTSANIMTEQ